ncbi:hemicentin-1-like isoform X3 [Betta splendens]|uniref:Hemicentin-1-like isoform X3 n=1 Tax=Betta splendens TaxID=158456 RepID=A0A9W2XMT6_BETSP|nr:hemicentin-1-like isoform X3 [Betta splendens]
MGHTFLCELQFLLLIRLFWCGHAEAQNPKARLTAGPSTISVGGSVTLSCSVDGSDGWKYEWYSWTSNTNVTPAADGDNREIRVTQGGVYTCIGRRKDTAFYTQYSDYVTIEITYSNSVSVSLQLDWTQVIRGQITVRCEIQGGGDTQWVYYWETTSGQTITQRTDTNYWTVSEFSSGGYRCRGTNRQDPYHSTRWSEAAALKVSGAVLTFDPSRSRYFTGESVTFTCDMKDRKRTEWETRLIKDGGEIASYSGYRTKALSTRDSGRYQCFRVHRKTNHIKTSATIYLTVSDKPKPRLTAGPSTISVGGSVTLSCSVDGSDGWKYDWFRSEALIRTNTESRIRITDGGNYYCRGGRGNPVYYTQNSVSVTVEERVSNKAAVKRQHDWPEIFKGEEITLTCEIQAGGDTEWEYEWTQGNVRRTADGRKLWVFTASGSSSGDYKCRGRQKTSYSSTAWSDPLRLTVTDKAQCVLTASPSWLSPGASVALSCEVEPPSAGWRFYWYQTVPDGSHSSYRYELLPGSEHGTEQGSYMLDGHTHTAGYVCRAARGEPVYYTDYSKAAFVWSGDVDPSASLTVSPDTVQHFTRDSVSLSCEGNSTEWRVRRFPEGGFLSSCSYWTTSGSRCDIITSQSGSAVFWCESGSGHFSNSVNITVHDAGPGLILMSPVRPVTEGLSVSLSCKLKTGQKASSVFFYHNEQLIQNDSRVELNISAVSKSHEGFYKCWYQGTESPQSWMAVNVVSRSDSFSLPESLIVGLVCGVFLVIVLLLWSGYQTFKGWWIIRSKRTNQSSAADHMTKKEALHTNGDLCLYESVKGSEDAEKDESNNVTYAAIEFKNIANSERIHRAAERCVYSEVKVKLGPAAGDDVVYAQVSSHSKHKVDKDLCFLENTRPNKTVYSEIKKKKPTTHGDDANMTQTALF